MTKKMNEKGLFYPFVLFLIVLLSFVITIQADFLIREKRILKLSSILLQQEYYFKQSITYLDEQFHLNDELPIEGEYLFNHGTVYYDLEDQEGGLIKINLEVQINGVANVEAIAYYSLMEKEVVKWMEIERK
ncbi:competence type IV pilus minor pilin ComGG [Cytobacillus sp. FSL R5-0569]|uniref:competence type IV pilus minor pilin ComGG n=1 Tax=Cytobacillus sp. FSL R5-0569 TaxID=2921649 RepID=UPI0030F819FF